jgi:hypothetical protein
MDACHLHPTRAIMKNEAIKKKMKKKKTKKTSRISEKDVVVVHERDVREGREAGSWVLFQQHFANSRAPHRDSPCSELKRIWVGRGCFPFAIVANTCTCRRWELRV